jgi:hypothetical protein
LVSLPRDNKVVEAFYDRSKQTPESSLRRSRHGKTAADFKEAQVGALDHAAHDHQRG